MDPAPELRGSASATAPRTARGRTASLAATCLAVLGLAACGGGSDDSSSPSGSSTGSDSLTVYSSLPLGGAAKADTASMVRGEKLALLEFGGRVGRFSVKYVSLDETAADGEGSDPEKVIENAQQAARDKTVIAVLGGYTAASSALALPVLNQARVLQVSPTSSYTGLTGADGAGKGEPDRYYPSGERTFARVVPTDEVHARAVVDLQRDEGCDELFVLRDRTLDGDGMAAAVELVAKEDGPTVSGTADLDLDEDLDRERLADVAGTVAESGANCVFYGGRPGAAAARVWRAVGTRSPGVTIYATGVPAADDLDLGAVGRRVVLVSPALDRDHYPEAGQDFYRSYRARYGAAPGPDAIFGYEAMKLVLTAIQDAGEGGNDRQRVIDAVFDVRDRDSVLGEYSITRTGDTTLSRFAVRRYEGDRLVVDRIVDPE